MIDYDDLPLAFKIGTSAILNVQHYRMKQLSTNIRIV